MSKKNKAKNKNPPAAQPSNTGPYDFSWPLSVTGLDCAIGGDMRKLLPPYDLVRAGEHITKHRDLVSTWFFCGLKRFDGKPREGIDPKTALGHLAAIMRSWDPPHEHKEAAVAWLIDKWFESVEWEKVDRAPR